MKRAAKPSKRAVSETAPAALDAAQLAAPVPAPSKIWAAAGNYKRGSANLSSAGGRGEARERPPDELLEHIFLKPPSAVVGPGKDILIPADAETIFPELELCVVIGRESRNLSVDEALEARVRLQRHPRRHRTGIRIGQEPHGHPQCAQGVRHFRARGALDRHPGRDSRSPGPGDAPVGERRPATVRQHRRNDQRRRPAGELPLAGGAP